MYYVDSWPTITDGNDYDGRNLLRMLHEGRSPFADRWDVKLLIREVEHRLSAEVVDIPAISNGSNKYVYPSTCLVAFKVSHIYKYIYIYIYI